MQDTIDTPKKVIFDDEVDDFGRLDEFCYCPNCNESVDEELEFCCNCGQKLDWN